MMMSFQLCHPVGCFPAYLLVGMLAFVSGFAAAAAVDVEMLSIDLDVVN